MAESLRQTPATGTDTVEEVEQFDAQAMLDLLHVQLTATRQRCGLLCFKVLKTLAYSFDGAGPAA